MGLARSRFIAIGVVKAARAKVESQVKVMAQKLLSLSLSLVLQSRGFKL